MSDATRQVALELDALSSDETPLGENRHQQPTTRRVLRSLQGGAVDESEITLQLPNWNPVPGGVDVIVRGEAGNPRFAVELKLEKTHWMLWDAYKMVDALELEQLEAVYMMLGASTTGWNSEFRNCSQGAKTTELFEEGEIIHDSAELFEQNAHAWTDLLWGGTGRPTRVPASIRTVQVADAPLSFYGKDGSLKCVRIESASTDWLEFSSDWYAGEWPSGVQPCDHYLEWREVPRQSP